MRPHARLQTFQDRRNFLQSLAAMAAVGPAGVPALLEGLQPSITLKSGSVYSQFSGSYNGALTTMQRLSSSSITTTTDMERVTQESETAGYALDGYFDSLVSRCAADSSLVNWTKQNLRTKASFDRFISQLRTSPSALDTVTGVSALKSQIATIAATQRALIEQLRRLQATIAAMQDLQAAMASSSREATCTKNWGIVAAIVVTVVAEVVAVVTASSASWGGMSASEAIAHIAQQANGLASTWSATTMPAGGGIGGGKVLPGSPVDAANSSYRLCVNATRTMTAAQRAKAIAACQVRWLGAKATFIA